jgi:hypothetical protein
LRDDYIDARLGSLARLSHRRDLLDERAARGMRTLHEIAGLAQRK